MNERLWIRFKNSIYLIGVTYILCDIAINNLGIIYELLFFRENLYAFITLQLTLMLLPIWALSVGQIVKQWRLELSYDQQTKDYLSSSSS
jgi:hypothetical protein